MKWRGKKEFDTGRDITRLIREDKQKMGEILNIVMRLATIALYIAWGRIKTD
jgi:hypothetical protein